jgi:peptidoglycan-associated lipoprotein
MNSKTTEKTNMFPARHLTLSLMLLAVLLAAGCGRKKAPVMVPTPLDTSPPPARTTPAPTAVLEVEPARILSGERAILRWRSTGATRAELAPGAGSVETTGTMEVSPTADTVFRLTVSGIGGEATATARLTVMPGRDDSLGTRRSGVTSEDLLPNMNDRINEIRDIYFGYDQSDIPAAEQDKLIQNAALLKLLFADYPNGRILIEGHCDERGSNEYNLALGDRRASVVRDFLVSQGVPAANMRTVSYGEEKPQCSEPNEACWSSNRRAHFTPAP